jgi:prepilin-type N-terminal cleavage/methylation domain-containing protein
MLSEDRRRAKSTPSSGFTLIELVISVSIIALTLAFARPSFEQFNRVHRVKGAARQIYTMLQRARLAAIDENVKVTADFTEIDITSGTPGKLEIVYPQESSPADLDLSQESNFKGAYIGKVGSTIDVTFQPDGSADQNQSILIGHTEDPSIIYYITVLKGGGIRFSKG